MLVALSAAFRGFLLLAAACSLLSAQQRVLFRTPGEKFRQVAHAAEAMESAAEASAHAIGRGVSHGLSSGITSAVTNAARHTPDPHWLADGARRAAAEAQAAVRHQPMWAASLAALVTASAVDAHSSWGKPEANPLLANSSGRFGARGVAIKAIITGAAVGFQYALVKRKPAMARYATIGNAALTGIYARVAVHNYGNTR